MGPGSDTAMITWSMEPQADGTLRGIRTTTGITNRCGLRGVVDETPFVATRVRRCTNRSHGGRSCNGKGPAVDQPDQRRARVPHWTVCIASTSTFRAKQSTDCRSRGPAQRIRMVGVSVGMQHHRMRRRRRATRSGQPPAKHWYRHRTRLQRRTLAGHAANLQPPEQCSNGPDADVSTVSWSLSQPEHTTRRRHPHHSDRPVRPPRQRVQDTYGR